MLCFYCMIVKGGELVDLRLIHCHVSTLVENFFLCCCYYDNTLTHADSLFYHQEIIHKKK